MGAADRFKGANTKFSERGEYLIPIQKEETYEVEVNGVKTGKTATRVVYDSPANYEVKIKRCYWKTARDKAEYYIVEYEVVKSNNPKVAVGALRTWMQAMDNDVGPTASTDFMFAALGKDRRNAIDLAEIKKLDADGELPGMLASTLEDPTDPTCENSLKDLFVEVEVKQITTKKKGEPFNLHTFFPAKKAAA
jgi:hypothetical protein